MKGFVLHLAGSFAGDRLQCSGRCHETEVYSAFRKSFARYRSPDVVPDHVLRSMVKKWFPGARRTSKGYYKNLSVTPKDI
mmetsp:Transcript_6837/g.16523  ORF Transcript_6837/g.16523 Transcript_6837/m.16523 type:complete len:80 (-) Transcript_6837:119-358(-)